MNEQLYINDLVHRFPNYSFAEMQKNDLVIISFLDEAGEVVAQATSQSPRDAYSKIRADVLGDDRPIFLSSTAERDGLTDVGWGRLIYNTDLGRAEAFDGSSWRNAAGAGIQSPAYGELFQDIPEGYLIPDDGIWAGGATNIVDASGNVRYGRNDSFVIGADGAGDYAVAFSTSFTNSNGEETTAHFHLNDESVDKVKESHAGDSGEKRDLSSSGILRLVADDKLQFYMESGSVRDEIMVYEVNVNIRRIS